MLNITYTHSNPIIQAQERKIKEREERIRLEQEELKIDKARLEGMLAMLNPSSSPSDAMAATVQTAVATELSSPERKRPISDKWAPIFHRIENECGQTIDELARYAKAEHGIERKLLTAQVSYYTKQGLMRPPEDNGKIQLTDEGRKASGAHNPHMLPSQPDHIVTAFDNVTGNL